MIPLVRGSVVSPNGFTGITISVSSPEIYDFDAEQIPTVSCEIEVDEPDHIQAKPENDRRKTINC